MARETNGQWRSFGENEDLLTMWNGGCVGWTNGFVGRTSGCCGTQMTAMTWKEAWRWLTMRKEVGRMTTIMHEGTTRGEKANVLRCGRRRTMHLRFWIPNFVYDLGSIFNWGKTDFWHRLSATRDQMSLSQWHFLNINKLFCFELEIP